LDGLSTSMTVTSRREGPVSRISMYPSVIGSLVTRISNGSATAIPPLPDAAATCGAAGGAAGGAAVRRSSMRTSGAMTRRQWAGISRNTRSSTRARRSGGRRGWSWSRA
jgi:hypothetical protein